LNDFETDEDTLYIRCPHGMATFRVHREPVTCPECGDRPLYVEKYDRWYCAACEEYTEPVDERIAWPAKDRAPNEPAAAPDYWQY
jgi:ribosomal protein S27AE